MESTIARRSPVTGTASSMFAGAGNVFQKEFREWFRTRRFLVTTVLTSLMLAAVPVVAFLHEGGLSDGRVDSGYRGVMNAWVALTLTLGAYLIVALTMSIIVKEEDSGTAQWIFTKP
ncbi:MAG: ABC transporter permease, partial [Tepidiformaceae bacterium]